MPQCKAKAKSTGERCRRSAVAGRTVCRVHGGAQSRGLAHPNTKHGRYSRHLPSRLQGRYEAARADKSLMQLRDDVALAETRLQELVGGLDTDATSDIWERLRKLRDDTIAHMNAGAMDKAQACQREIFTLIGRGAEDAKRWREVLQVQDHKKRLVESERKALVEAQQMITVEQMMLTVARLVEIIHRHVQDRKSLAAIAADLDREVMDVAPRWSKSA